MCGIHIGVGWHKPIDRRRKPGSDLVLILMSFRDGFRAHSFGFRGDRCFVISFALAFTENCP